MPTQAINSTSRICAILQRGFGKVMAAIEALNLKPCATIDGTVYFDDEQLELLRRYFAEKEKP